MASSGEVVGVTQYKLGQLILGTFVAHTVVGMRRMISSEMPVPVKLP